MSGVLTLVFVRLSRERRGRVQQVRPTLQTEKLPSEPSEMGVREGAPVPMPVLQLQGQTEDARRPSHREDAQGKARHAGGH
jgi:hypothetical protein